MLLGWLLGAWAWMCVYGGGGVWYWGRNHNPEEEEAGYVGGGTRASRKKLDFVWSRKSLKEEPGRFVKEPGALEPVPGANSAPLSPSSQGTVL